jgi:hypothetical protein
MQRWLALFFITARECTDISPASYTAGEPIALATKDESFSFIIGYCSASFGYSWRYGFTLLLPEAKRDEAASSVVRQTRSVRLYPFSGDARRTCSLDRILCARRLFPEFCCLLGFEAEQAAVPLESICPCQTMNDPMPVYRLMPLCTAGVIFPNSLVGAVGRHSFPQPP